MEYIYHIKISKTMRRKILFITWTRADYWKIKSLTKLVEKSSEFELFLFITWMHVLNEYWYTAQEIINEWYKNIYLNINQFIWESSDLIISNTIRNLSEYISEIKPDLIVVHWDRIEALAWAIVWVLKNILVAHIEWWELSWSIDESIRYSISKLAHIHFVSNKDSANRLIQTWENKNNIYIIGSSEFDIILWDKLPKLEEVKSKYNINFNNYWIFIFHPVTTEYSYFSKYVHEVIKWLNDSNKNFIIICPNNDLWNDCIIKEFKKLNKWNNYKVFKSISFEDFIILLKNSKCIVWNSSTWVRQAPALWIPTINIWTRQNNRNKHKSIFNLWYDKTQISSKINELWLDNDKYIKNFYFWKWNSGKKFIEIIKSDKFWKTNIQKIIL
jgi:UDP-N-acetylglucosamine 2-epimerase (hydrolysing)